MYKSTRSKKLVSASEAIINGIAEDKGLYLPEKLPSIKFDESWVNFSYQDIAKKVFRLYFDDFSDEEIEYVVSNAYNQRNFQKKIYGLKLHEDHAFLELFHGNTFAFKDMALSALPWFMDVARKKLKIKKKISIVVATSGDTGGAVLNAFKDFEDIGVVVLYPNNGVSKTQEAQMKSLQTNHSKAFAYEGNFDDCQKLAKEILKNYGNSKDHLISSANSINIARLIPQIVYYIAAYFDLVKRNFIKYGEKLNVSVPTGNFGNILAGYFAKKMGLPIGNLLCASNQNDVLTEFFVSGRYNKKRQFYLTRSPSMDILVSSNLERLISLIVGEEKCLEYMNNLEEKGEYSLDEKALEKINDFYGFKASDEEVLGAINELYKSDKYLIDPHTAVAYLGYKNANFNGKTLIVSTAAPYKFIETVNLATNKDFRPFEFENVVETVVLSKQEILDYILLAKEEAIAHASSANIGIGFDCLGVGIDLENKVKYMPFDRYLLLGFGDKYNKPDHNLLVSAYEYVAKAIKQEVKPLCIELVKCDIPISRGLGSSSALLLLGVLIAKQVYKIEDEKFLMKLMVDLEGHPDNIIPAYLGGLIVSYNINNEIKYHKFPISDELIFNVGYPKYKVSTKKARKVLPKKYFRAEVVHNLSRMAIIAEAFKLGDIKLLKEILDDKIHEPYRKEFIKEYDHIEEVFKNDDIVSIISGSGPTMLFISKNDIDFERLGLKDWTFKKVEIYKGGK